MDGKVHYHGIHIYAHFASAWPEKKYFILTASMVQTPKSDDSPNRNSGIRHGWLTSDGIQRAPSFQVKPLPQRGAPRLQWLPARSLRVRGVADGRHEVFPAGGAAEGHTPHASHGESVGFTASGLRLGAWFWDRVSMG